MGAHFQQLLHSEGRWLSRGKILTRLWDLREEVLLFLTEMNSPLVKHMEDMGCKVSRTDLDIDETHLNYFL